VVKKRIECEKCEAVAVIEADMEPHFYNIEFCPYCGEELELEEEYKVNDVYQEEYEANS